MELVFLIGRLIVGIYYVYSASNHFRKLHAMSGYAESKGIPEPKLAVQFSGVLLLIGGLSFLTGFQPIIGIIALVLFFIPVTFTMHAFWKVEDQRAKMQERVNFNKNIALMGSALMFWAIPPPWVFSL